MLVIAYRIRDLERKFVDKPVLEEERATEGEDRLTLAADEAPGAATRMRVREEAHRRRSVKMTWSPPSSVRPAHARDPRPVPAGRMLQGHAWRARLSARRKSGR